MSPRAMTPEELAEFMGPEPEPASNVVRLPSKPKVKRNPFDEWTPEEIENQPATSWLVGDKDHPVLLEGSLWQVLGKLKSAKTFYVMEIAFCIAHGLAFEGLPVKQGNVAYVIVEGTIWLNYQRVKALGHKYAAALREKYDLPADMSDDDVVREVLHERGKGRFNLISSPVALAALKDDDPNGPTAFLDQLKNHPYKLVVLDTWARALWASGGHDSDQQTVGPSIQACDRIRAELDCALIMVAHVGVAANATGRAKGLSDPAGAVDGATLCQKTGTGPEAVYKFTATFQRHAVEGFSLSAKLRETGPSVTLEYQEGVTATVAKLKPRDQRALDLLQAMGPGASLDAWRVAIRADDICASQDGEPIAGNALTQSVKRMIDRLLMADRIEINGDMVSVSGDDAGDEFGDAEDE